MTFKRREANREASRGVFEKIGAPLFPHDTPPPPRPYKPRVPYTCWSVRSTKERGKENMEHHSSMAAQSFFARCDPPPLHPRCIPVFGGGEEVMHVAQQNAEYYLTAMEQSHHHHHHQRQQQELHQLHHNPYETPEEYRSPQYYYAAAPSGPPPYYSPSTEMGGGGPSLASVGVPAGLHPTTGLELPMRADTMGRYVHRLVESPTSPIYESAHRHAPTGQQLIGTVSCASVGLPLAPEQWPGVAGAGGQPPVLHKAPDFELIDHHQLAMHQHPIRDERPPAFDWLPQAVAQGDASIAASSAFATAGRFHSANAAATAGLLTVAASGKEQDQSSEQRQIRPVLKSKLRSGRLGRSKNRKDIGGDADGSGGGPVPKFQCFLCAKQYCRRSTLKTHLRHHSGERPYFCTVCGKSFAQAANLTAHKRIHTGEKPFACPICCRPFSQSSSLVTHKRTHTGEKPYQCPRCDKAFTDSSTLTKHVRTHTGVKPYSCGICLLSFSQSGNLNRHMKTHLKQQSTQEMDQDARSYEANTSAYQQNATRMI